MSFINKNKKGSAAVMLAMLFVCLMMVAVILINVSAAVATYAYSDAVLLSAGRSILSEYHLALKDYYGIMAFKGYEKEINTKLKFYISASFNKTLPGRIKPTHESITFINPIASDINCDLKEYSLANVDILETQIEEIMKYNIVNLGINYVTQGVNENNASTNTKISSKNSRGEQGGDFGERKLINQKIINGLPSKGLERNGISISLIVDGGIPSWEDITEKGSARYYVNEYVLNYFNQRFNEVEGPDPFFKNEVEYVLYGKLSDQENSAKFIDDFRILRVLLNSAHVYADPQKRQEVITLAELMTPGPEAIATAVILSEAWAYAEAINDIKLIEAGKNVSLIKTKATWALTLNAALNGLNTKSYVKPNSDKGYSYKDYLRLFLYFENREIKLLRIMDLIQINIKLNADQSFNIKDCYVGLKYGASVNRQRYEYAQRY